MRRSFVIIGLCLLFGAVWRLYALDQAPYWKDEGYTVNAVLSIAEHGSTTLDSGATYHCPLYCYPSAWISRYVGDTALSYRLWAVLAGLALIPLAYHLGRRLAGPLAGGWAAGGVTFAYYLVAWSRQARWYTLLTLWFWLTLYSFQRWRLARARGHLFLAISSCCLAIATHPLGWLLPVILFGWLLYDFGVTRRWRPLLIGGGGLIIAVGLLHGGFHIDVRDLLHRGQWNPTQFWPYFNFLLANYWLPLLLTGLGWWLADTPTRRHLNYLLTPLLIYLLALAWGGDTIAYRYLLPAASLLYVSGGAGAALLLAKLPHRLVRLTIGLAITGLFFAGGGGQPYPQTFYTLEHDVGPALAYAHYTPQANWNQAYAYIEIHRRPGDIVISSEPQFNKIFLHEAGYYLRYLYREGPAVPVDDQHREYYVGAKTISHARELNRILNQHSGFLVLDTLAVENHLPADVAELIKSRMRLVYVSEGNAYSRVWVYERAD